MPMSNDHDAPIDGSAVSVMFWTLISLAVDTIKLEGLPGEQNARNLNKFAYSYKQRFANGGEPWRACRS